MSDVGEIKNIHYGDILVKYGDVLSATDIGISFVGNSKKFKKGDFLKDGDIIIADTAEDETVGKSIEITDSKNIKLVAGLHTMACRPKISFGQAYLGYYINSPAFHYQLIPLMQGIKVTSISKSNILTTFIRFPSLPEQKKIAAFFTLLDRRIQKQRQLVECLKTYKRGVMNKLFNENVEFDKYLKWEKVDEIFKTINDKPYQVQSCSYLKNGLYDIIDQGKKEIVGFCDYNDKLFIDVPVIIYGDHTTLVKYREKKFIIGGDGVKLLKSRDSSLNLKYLYYALLQYNIKPEGYKRHFSILKEVSLPIFEKCIQDEIAKIMTCIDSCIKLHENKLSSLLSLKSALLQKMFI